VVFRLTSSRGRSLGHIPVSSPIGASSIFHLTAGRWLQPTVLVAASVLIASCSGTSETSTPSTAPSQKTSAPEPTSTSASVPESTESALPQLDIPPTIDGEISRTVIRNHGTQIDIGLGPKPGQPYKVRAACSTSDPIATLTYNVIITRSTPIPEESPLTTSTVVCDGKEITFSDKILVDLDFIRGVAIQVDFGDPPAAGANAYAIVVPG